jgi:hypothetical protein
VLLDIGVRKRNGTGKSIGHHGKEKENSEW